LQHNPLRSKKRKKEEKKFKKKAPMSRQGNMSSLNRPLAISTVGAQEPVFLLQNDQQKWHIRNSSSCSPGAIWSEEV
jgi:hypothetical protein